MFLETIIKQNVVNSIIGLIRNIFGKRDWKSLRAKPSNGYILKHDKLFEKQNYDFIFSGP